MVVLDVLATVGHCDDCVDLVAFVAFVVAAFVVCGATVVGHFFRRHRHRLTIALFEFAVELEFDCNFLKIIGSGPANASASGYAPGSP